MPVTLFFQLCPVLLLFLQFHCCQLLGGCPGFRQSVLLQVRQNLASSVGQILAEVRQILAKIRHILAAARQILAEVGQELASVRQLLASVRQNLASVRQIPIRKRCCRLAGYISQKEPSPSQIRQGISASFGQNVPRVLRGRGGGRSVESKPGQNDLRRPLFFCAADQLQPRPKEADRRDLPALSGL
jgi:hypothetical protein